MPTRTAYLALNTYPETGADPAILAAIGLAGAMGHALHVATFAVDVPPVGSPLGGFLINVEGLARAAEERSRAECERLRALITAHATDAKAIHFSNHRPVMGAALDLAAVQARYFDLALVPWSPQVLAVQDIAQALVFGSGLPTLLVPADAPTAPLRQLAIAWDESRVAARALGDALRLLPDGGAITVLTVQDEKALSGPGIADRLAAALAGRGYAARAVNLTPGRRPIAQSLQEAALAEGAQLLAMGGFGHSRLRDFVLGGATTGILGDLRLPVLMAH